MIDFEWRSETDQTSPATCWSIADFPSGDVACALTDSEEFPISEIRPYSIWQMEPHFHSNGENLTGRVLAVAGIVESVGTAAIPAGSRVIEIAVEEDVIAEAEFQAPAEPSSLIESEIERDTMTDSTIHDSFTAVAGEGAITFLDGVETAEPEIAASLSAPPVVVLDDDALAQSASAIPEVTATPSPPNSWPAPWEEPEAAAPPRCDDAVILHEISEEQPAPPPGPAPRVLATFDIFNSADP